jgi:cytochrome P450
MTSLVAGYEITSSMFPVTAVLLALAHCSDTATLTWTLIELCRNLELQDKIRKEILAEFPNSNPTFDEVVAGLPLLDAVTQEALRLHPSVVETWRTVVYMP